MVGLALGARGSGGAKLGPKGSSRGQDRRPRAGRTGFGFADAVYISHCIPPRLDHTVNSLFTLQSLGSCGSA